MKEIVLNPAELRRRLGVNQQEFWARIRVSQSGGSRYESGRAMPGPVRELLRLVYVGRLDLSKVNREDFAILDYLKAHQPELYQSLRQEVAAKHMDTAVSIQRERQAAPESKTRPIKLVRRNTPLDLRN